MGAQFSRQKEWVKEPLTYQELNTEIDNLMENLRPQGIDDYSDDVSQMRETLSPGTVGNEALAESLADELKQLRYVILRMLGDEDYWYSASPYSLSSLASAVSGGLSVNRIISGRSLTGMAQPAFLVPHGAARTVTLAGASTNFVYSIANVQYTIDSNVTVTSLGLAPASNNTCLVNDAAADSTEWTKHFGEYGSELPVDAMGTEITALVGKVAGFKVGATEYFTAYVESATKLTHIQRGNFFNSVDAALPRLVLADNDTITLMRLTWVFAKTDGTLAVNYNPPRVGKDEPTSPASGDYWYDTDNELWKTYNGATFVSAGALLVGICMQDTANTVCARSFDFYRAHSELGNGIALVKTSSTEVRSAKRSEPVAVYGAVIRYENDFIRWSMLTDLDTGLTEAASTLYYFYVTDNGESIISTIAPQERPDLLGLYHPHKSYRCLGQAFNDASSNLGTVISYDDLSEKNFALTHAVASNALTVMMHAPPAARQKLRNTTLAVGELAQGTVLPGTKFVAASGSTLGHTAATLGKLFIGEHIQDKRIELSLCTIKHGEGALVTTTAEAGNADSGILVYSLVARTSVPYKVIGRAESTQATAGVWATALSDISTVINPEDLSVEYAATGTLKLYGVPSIQVLGWGGGGGGGTGGDGLTGVGGGGGGGGGGAVELRENFSIISGDELTFTIGAGGASQTNGTASTIVGTGVSFSFPGGARGGGGGNGDPTAGSNGGSVLGTGGTGGATGSNAGGGGGGAGGWSLGGNGGAGAATNGVVGSAGVSYFSGGGGGGGSDTAGADGGVGARSIRSSSTAAGGGSPGTGGGGGGGGSSRAAGGAGGAGGASGVAGSAAAANSAAGGGGGGGRDSNGAGAAGGAGGSGYFVVYWVA